MVDAVLTCDSRGRRGKQDIAVGIKPGMYADPRSDSGTDCIRSGGSSPR